MYHCTIQFLWRKTSKPKNVYVVLEYNETIHFQQFLIRLEDFIELKCNLLWLLSTNTTRNMKTKVSYRLFFERSVYFLIILRTDNFVSLIVFKFVSVPFNIFLLLSVVFPEAPGTGNSGRKWVKTET